MKFPNAYRGIKKLFIAEVVGVCATLLLLISACLAIAGVHSEGALIAAGSLTLVATLGLLALFIVEILALREAGKDNEKLKLAFFYTIAGIVFSFVGSILSSIPAVRDSLFAGLIQSAIDVTAIFTLYYIFIGIAELANKLGNPLMERHGRSLANVSIILFVASIALSFPANFINGSAVPEWTQGLFATLALVASLAELVAYVLTLIYYYRAVKMLSK